jgi:PhnB protein
LAQNDLEAVSDEASTWPLLEETRMVKAIPDGLHTLTAQLTIDGADKAIDWYKKAFGAELLTRAPDPSGKKVWHASIKIGDSVFFVNDAFPEMGGNAHVSSLWLYSDKVDQLWKRAVDAGGKVTMPIADMFWGDRSGTLLDPFGNRWSLGQHMKDMTPEEMQRAGDAFAAAQQQPDKQPAKPKAKAPQPKQAKPVKRSTS